jgi:YegS C-terminal NAD kinase beta sandwich-like domain
MIKPGDEWGTPTTAGPDLEVWGDDAELARAAARRPGALIRFRPTGGSDLARAVGGQTAGTARVEVRLDALRVDDHGLACNMVVLGVVPDRLRRLSRRRSVTVTVDGVEWFTGRATTVVVANGEFHHGLDLVPRGHPGDGRVEVQVYALAPAERAGMRARLAAGTHVPHPRIAQRTGRKIDVRWVRKGSRRRLELDGRRRDRTDRVTIEVVAGAYRLLV